MLRRCLLVAALLVAGGAAPAAAAPVAETEGLRVGPSLVGDGGIAWADLSRRRWSIHLAHGRRERTVASGGMGHFDALGAWSAAGDTAMLELRTEEGDRADVRVLQVALDTGRSRIAAKCKRFPAGQDLTPGQAAPAALSTDGTAIAVAACGQTKVLSALDGAPWATLDAPTGPIALAGPYLATVTGSDVRVREWKSGLDVYRAPLPTPTPPRAAVDLQPDGDLALVTAATGKLTCQASAALSFHTIADPVGHDAGVAPCLPRVSTLDDRAAVITAAPDGDGLVVAEVSEDGTRRDVDVLGSGAGLIGGLDLGRAGTIFARACSGTTAILRTPGEARPRGTDCARLAISSAKRTGDTVTVKARLTRAAGGLVTAGLRTGGRTHRASGRPRGGRITLELPARGEGPFVLSLTYPGDATYAPQTLTREVR